MSALTLAHGKMPHFAPSLLRRLSEPDEADPHMRIVTDPGHVPEIYDSGYTAGVILRGAFDLAASSARLVPGFLPEGRRSFKWGFQGRATPNGIAEMPGPRSRLVDAQFRDVLRATADIVWALEGRPSEMQICFELRRQGWNSDEAIPLARLRDRGCLPHKDEKIRARAVVVATPEDDMMTELYAGAFTAARLGALRSAFRTAHDLAAVKAEYGCRPLRRDDILFLKGTSSDIGENARVHATPLPRAGAYRIAAASTVYRADARRQPG